MGGTTSRYHWSVWHQPGDLNSNNAVSNSYSKKRCNHASTSNPIVTIGIGDYGTTGSCACLNSNVVDVKPTGIRSIKVTLANGACVYSACTGYLPNQNLTLQSILVHLLPKLNKVLLSLCQFCDAGMKIILTKTKLIAAMDDAFSAVMLEDDHAKSDGMWSSI